MRTSIALAMALAAALAGCASGAPAIDQAAVANPTAAPLIATPPTSVGNWVDLGQTLAPWLAGDAPVPVSGASAPTRVAGLRRDDGHWLAIVVTQLAPTGSAPCPAPTSLQVPDAGAGGCLRLRRDADFDHWLARQHPVLERWLDQRGWSARPRAWAGFRSPGAGGGTIETHALIDPSLIEPATRNNADFLAGGEPGRQWAQRFAAASRAAGGTLQVPPFPFAPQLAPPPVAAARVSAPPPTRAVQVPARAPVQAPRPDRQ